MNSINSHPEEYDLLVLGSGAGGKVLAATFAQKGQRVIVVERKYVGGSCPNIACLPSKNIIHSAKVASFIYRSNEFGISKENVHINLAAVRERKRKMVRNIVDIFRDTFYTKSGQVLRTHTSNIQVRAMSTQKPPFAFIAPGPCYRVDSDLTHSPMFHQVEAFLVDEHVTLAHLKGVLAEFAERFYGPGTPIRLRPSYFPFTEPSAEVDVGCVFCKRPDGTRAGCAVCKHSGWLEILGSGMIDPVVFTHSGLDPERWTGFALGMGIERQAMLRYGIPEIRLLFENDPRFLAQF